MRSSTGQGSPWKATPAEASTPASMTASAWAPAGSHAPTGFATASATSAAPLRGSIAEDRGPCFSSKVSIMALATGEWRDSFLRSACIQSLRSASPKDAEPMQPLLNLARRHRPAVVGEQGPRQAPLHEGLAEPVYEDLGGLLQIPLQVTAEPGAVVEEAEQDGRLPFARRRQHPALAVVEVGVPQRVSARDLVCARLTRLRQ